MSGAGIALAVTIAAIATGVVAQSLPQRPGELVGMNRASIAEPRSVVPRNVRRQGAPVRVPARRPPNQPAMDASTFDTGAGVDEDGAMPVKRNGFAVGLQTRPPKTFPYRNASGPKTWRRP